MKISILNSPGSVKMKKGEVGIESIVLSHYLLGIGLPKIQQYLTKY